MSSQICLKWNSFLNNIATSFESLWEEEGLVDVTLASDGQCLTAHKVILSASSPFFKKVFQANPCQHPVIILQDVHFSELEALLIFIYKGEVNIEQKNLPALLKAAETLQIRGLSGGDIFAKESYKRLAELEQAVLEDVPTVREDSPKKRQKSNKHQNNSILETALAPKIGQSESTNESTVSEQSAKDAECSSENALVNQVYQRLEMKIEPLEITTDDPSKRSPLEKEPAERLDTGQGDGSQGFSKPGLTIIAEAREVRLGGATEGAAAAEGVATTAESWNITKSKEEVTDRALNRSELQMEFTMEEQPDYPNVLAAHNTKELRGTFPRGSTTGPSNPEFSEATIKGGPPAYPPFPCPFCDRAYTSWGFRRRHIKAVHTISPSLNCKWCLQVLPTHGAWRRHVISAHNLSASDAHNGLLILEEAHMVLQIARPTRLDALVNIIKQSSQQNNSQDNTCLSKD